MTASASNARIFELLTPLATKREVREVRIGLGYTAVSLDDGAMGLAYTFTESARGGCSVFEGIRPLAGRPAERLLEYLLSGDAIEAAVGLATANALANRPSPSLLEGDVLEHLGLSPTDRVGMVGYFAPLVAPLKARVKELEIFELRHRPGTVTTSADKELSGLATCHVAIITATSLLNGTLDSLLAATAECREVVILGASTPLIIDAFPSNAVSLLSGVVVTDPEAVLQVVSEGGGMRQFKRSLTKVTMHVTRG